MDDIPKDLPALLYAHKTHRRLTGAGHPGTGIAAAAGPSRLESIEGRSYPSRADARSSNSLTTPR
ncbi:MAG: hypothetical protein ACRDJF_04125, partial [Actinomycetota bacterium]